MKQSASYRRWCDGLSPPLYECLGVRGISQLVMAYAREFLGQSLAMLPDATTLGCMIGKLSNDRVVTVTDARNICVWSVINDEQVVALKLEGHTGCIFEIDCSSGSVIVSSSRDCTARVWDGDTGECRYELKHPNWVIAAVAIATDEFATCCSDDHLRVWHAGQCVAITHVNAYMLTALSNGQVARFGGVRKPPSNPARFSASSRP